MTAKDGIRAKGQKELIMHREGKRLSARQAVFGKCYDCMGGYMDGRVDCGVKRCPLHPYMPYREKQVNHTF